MNNTSLLGIGLYTMTEAARLLFKPISMLKGTAMQQDIPKPVFIIAIIAAVVLAIYFGKSALSEPPQPSKEEKAKFMPSWIDPATYKPRVGAMPATNGSGQPARSRGHNRAEAPSLPK